MLWRLHIGGRGRVIKSPDLIIEAGPAIKDLMATVITPAEAVKKQIVHLKGDVSLLEPFSKVFRIEAMPAKT